MRTKDFQAKILYYKKAYFQISMDDFHTVAVSDCIHKWLDGIWGLLLRVVLLFDNSVKQLSNKYWAINISLPLLQSWSQELGTCILYPQRFRKVSRHWGGLVGTKYQPLSAEPWHLRLPKTTYSGFSTPNLPVYSYLSMILIATFCPVFLLTALLTMANEPL